MPKLKIFLWQLYQNALPSRDTLLRRGLNIDPSCPPCQNDIESLDHIFFECHNAKQAWDLAISHKWLTEKAFLVNTVSLKDDLHINPNKNSIQFNRLITLL